MRASGTARSAGHQGQQRFHAGPTFAQSRASRLRTSRPAKEQGEGRRVRALTGRWRRTGRATGSGAGRAAPARPIETLAAPSIPNLRAAATSPARPMRPGGGDQTGQPDRHAQRKIWSGMASRGVARIAASASAFQLRPVRGQRRGGPCQGGGHREAVLVVSAGGLQR
jgi:hypothetical protein